MTPLKRELHTGITGRDVLAAKYALHAALGKAAKSDTRNRTFGPGTVVDVRAFQRMHNLESDGVIGPLTWSELEPHVPKSKRWLLTFVSKKGLTAEQKKRALLVHFATVFVTSGGSYYAQVRPVPLKGLPPIRKPNRTDCSGSVTQIYKEADCPDPNGKHYDGEAFTGYLRNHGRAIAFADRLPGDLCHHGTGRPGDPQHVTMPLHGMIGFSFGSNPPRFVDYSTYRRVLLTTRHDLVA